MYEQRKQVVREIHKPARRNFIRRRTILKGVDDLWQMDLMELQPYARINRGNKYILVVIDCYSKFIWTRRLKNKSAIQVTNAMIDVLKNIEGRIPKNLQTDHGKEFYNAKFAKLMKEHGINHYSTFSIKKAAIAERAIRTLKTWLYKNFSMRGTYKWIDVIDKITQDYNRRRHRTTGMKPCDVKSDTKLTVYDHTKMIKKSKFHVGDVVRISKFKSIFEKGYTPNWTTELFKIRKVQLTNPTTYLLEDMEGVPVSGGFYEEELQKAKYTDFYLVEKVLRKKGKNILVKWLGMNKTDWIDKTDLF